MVKVIRFFFFAILSICLVLPLQGSSSSADNKETGVVIIVDNSGSIGDKASGGRDVPTAKFWLDDIKSKSQKYYIDDKSLEDVDMGLIEMGGVCETKILSKLGASKIDIRTNLNGIEPDPNLKASTPILESISQAINILGTKRHPKIVLFTDLGENCIDKVNVNQCTLVKRMEDKLSANQVKADLALVGYKVDPKYAPTATGFFPTFPGLNCISNSKDFNFKYFSGGDSNSSLGEATEGSFNFLKPQICYALICIGDININITIVVSVSVLVLLAGSWLALRRILVGKKIK